MSNNLEDYDSDEQWLVAEFAKVWKVPSDEQIDQFCEDVAKLVSDDEFSEIEARKLSFDKING